MVGKFVDHHMGDKFLDRHVPALGPFVKDRAAVKPDHVRPGGLVAMRLFGQRDAVVKPAQLERVVKAKLLDRLVLGEILDAQADMGRRFAELRRERRDRLMRHLLDQGEGGGDAVGRWIGHAGEIGSQAAKGKGILRLWFRGKLPAKGVARAKDVKTTSADLDPAAFVSGVESTKRRAEAERLMEVFAQVTGWGPQLWGPPIVGYGRHVCRHGSGHGGTSLVTGLSPRKAELSVCILPGYSDFGPILSRLGLHRLGKACLYIRRLETLDEGVLGKLIAVGVAEMARRYELHPV